MMSTSEVEAGVRKKTCNGGLIKRVCRNFLLINIAAISWLYLMISNNILPIHNFLILRDWIILYIYI